MYIQFHLKLGTNNLCFWLVNVLLRKFDTLSKERNEKHKFYDKKQQQQEQQQQQKAKDVYESIM